MSKHQTVEEGLRLDKWLWAARLFKTRKLATVAVRAGHVELNGARAKPGRVVHTGDELSIQRGPYTFELAVEKLSGRRGPAKEAMTLYSESESSIAAREKLKFELKTRASQVIFDPKRPSKQDRRDALRRKRDTL